MFTLLFFPATKNKPLKERSDFLWCCLVVDAVLLLAILKFYHS